MKKHILVLVFSLTALFASAQDFDDMPYVNPDSATFFQQEMTALMKFQAEHNINVPFFLTFSYRITNGAVSQGYYDYMIKPYVDRIDKYDPNFGDFEKDTNFFSRSENIWNVFGGGQIKINNMFYIPIFVNYALAGVQTPLNVQEYTVNIPQYAQYPSITEIQGPARAGVSGQGLFTGAGLFINTEMIKGGVYLGCSLLETNNNEPQIDVLYAYGDEIKTHTINDINDNSNYWNPQFKFALVPLVNTSNWAVVGKVLESIFGYFGMGNALYAPAEDTGDSKITAFVNSINAALDLTFNRIHWGSLSLNINALYTRGNFDIAAKTDTYGLKVQGLLSNFPFGFNLEGGYKHFYSVSKYFTEDYPDTGYFSGSIFFPFRRITVGLMYQYNNIYGSTYSVAISTSFIKWFIGVNPNIRYADSEKFDGTFGMNAGVRYHHNGWKANKE